VFVITNEYKSPYLSPRGTKVKVFMFLDPRDAEACLREMMQTSEGAAEDAHITCMSFARAYKQARAGPVPTGQKQRLGGEVMMEYCFSPSSRDAAHVSKIGFTKRGRLVKPPALPGFECEGLTVTRDGARVRPVFLSRRDLEAAWQAERAANPRMPAKPPNVQVVDVLALCLALENDDGSFPVPGIEGSIELTVRNSPFDLGVCAATHLEAPSLTPSGKRLFSCAAAAVFRTTVSCPTAGRWSTWRRFGARATASRACTCA
jgi:hypothetical protein